jgi:dienelactone hydrolase
MQPVTEWSIAGSDGQTIIGNCHQPDAQPLGTVVIAHGFKGYKDYGMFPRIAAILAEHGFVVHRFNFSHSGMTNDIETFARPDLFEKNTWNREVTDLRAVIEAIMAGELPGTNLPYVLFGHSRGGVTCLLTAGRFADDASFPQPSGIVTAAAPSYGNPLSDTEADELLREGSIVSPSGRTGQDLRIGQAFLQEQQDDPEAHDVLSLAARIHCPVLILHGELDPTVPASAAEELRQALGERANMLIVSGGDHVFNTPNPMPDEQDPSEQLHTVLEKTAGFAKSVCEIAGQ